MLRAEIEKLRCAEAELQRSQGGIVHDFNNMLCTIAGFTDIVRQRRDIPADAAADLDEIADSAGRATALSRELLTVSQRQTFPEDVDAGNERAEPEPGTVRACGGTETILVVEDEIPVREFVSRLLRQCGYEVLAAASGIEALAVWREDGGRIDMLLTDMIMPDGFSGADLARRLRQENPELTIVYTSGYSMDFVGRKLVLMPGINFLQKPYMPDDLIRTVRENLDREVVAAAGVGER